MEYRIDPDILDLAMAETGCKSDEELGQVHLHKSGNTVRSYRKGATVPSIDVLMRLRKITGRPLDQMFIATPVAPGKAVA